MSRFSIRATITGTVLLLLAASLAWARPAASAAGAEVLLTPTGNTPCTAPHLSLAIVDGARRKESPAQDENWYVIVGSYPKAQRRKANARARYLRRRGYAAFVINTDDTDALTHGLLAVVIGPYSRAKAEQVLNGVRSFDSNAYIKAFFGMS